MAFHGFNPRAPRGARPLRRPTLTRGLQFQSTRPARGATATSRDRPAPRTGLIHAPRAGRDPCTACRRESLSMFQSTRPARGATLHQLGRPQPIRCFNPRAPRGARRSWTPGNRSVFQSTRPARGATTYHRVDPTPVCQFQSTRPRGARPASRTDWMTAFLVSIHAPRAGRDDRTWNLRADLAGVSIHAPRAGRDSATSPSVRL